MAVSHGRALSEAGTFRGSRKHVLDWTSRPEFVVELLQLVDPIHARVSATSLWMPRGYNEREEARLETFGPRALPDNSVWAALRTWWLAHEEGANTPNWDIALSCEIENRPGLILVEAKANVPELGTAGKSLGATASLASRENHDRIRDAINDACAYLKGICPDTGITRDSHYQLANRIAFTWKLASLGVPTVLVYLGFFGDVGIMDAGEPIRSAEHWDEVFAAYAYGQVPKDLFEKRIDCGAAPAWFLARAKGVLDSSPSHGNAIVQKRQ